MFFSKILWIFKFIIATNLELVPPNIYWAHISEADMDFHLESNLAFKAIDDANEVRLKVSTYTRPASCTLCGEKSTILFKNTQKSRVDVYHCISCFDGQYDSNHCMIQLKTDCKTLPVMYIVGKAFEFAKYSGCFFNVSLAAVETILFSSEIIPDFYFLIEKLENGSIVKIKKVGEDEVKCIAACKLGDLERFKDKNILYINNECMTNDKVLNSVCYRFNVCVEEEGKNFVFFIAIDNLNINYSDDLVKALTLVHKDIYKDRGGFTWNTKSKWINRIEEMGADCYSFNINAKINAAIENDGFDIVSKCIISAFTAMFCNFYDLKYPIDDPFIDNKVYELLVPRTKSFDMYTFWLLMSTEKPNVLFSSEKTDKMEKAICAFNKLKKYLNNDKVTELIREEARKIDIHKYFNDIDDNTVFIILEFKKKLTEEDKNFIILCMKTRFFSPFDFAFLAKDNEHTIGVFKVTGIVELETECHHFVSYAKEKFKRFNIIFMKFDIKGPNISYYKSKKRFEQVYGERIHFQESNNLEKPKNVLESRLQTLEPIKDLQAQGIEEQSSVFKNHFDTCVKTIYSTKIDGQERKEFYFFIDSVIDGEFADEVEIETETPSYAKRKRLAGKHATSVKRKRLK